MPHTRGGKPSAFMLLETRIMLGAAGAVAAAEVEQAQENTQQQAEPEPSDKTHATTDIPAAAAPEESPQRKAVAFVDAGISDAEALIDPAQDIDVYTLHDQQDGLEQINKILSQLNQENLDCIHIYSHANSNALQLGSSLLTNESIQGEHQEALQTLGKFLNSEGDILIYGCDFGGGEDGAQAIENIAKATQADIAASNDLSGHHSLGADWELEMHIGSVESATISNMEWIGVLNTQASISTEVDGNVYEDEENLDDNFVVTLSAPAASLTSVH